MPEPTAVTTSAGGRMSHGAAESWRERLARPIVEFPADLVAVLAFVALADVALAQPAVRGTGLAVALGLPLVLFAPGYALVAVLFPGAGPTSVPSGWRGVPSRARREGLTRGERAAVSFAANLVLLPPLAVLLSASTLGFTPLSVLGSVSLLTVVASLVAAARRVGLPSRERFSVSAREQAGRLGDALFDGGTGADAALNVALALAVLLAVGGLGYAVSVPTDGEQFSQLSILTKNDAGELVAAGHPSEFTAGEEKPVFVAVENHEERAVEYTVVVELQRVEQRPNGGARVVEETELDRFGERVGAGERWRTRYSLAPTMAGENLRVVYLLYSGDPPANPTTENADQHAHDWVNVTEA